MSGLTLYTLALALLGLSLIKDRQKTRMALIKSWKSFSGLLPQILSILLFVGISLALLSPATISGLIGPESGWLGVTLALVVGSVMLIPAFIAFPLAAALLKGGAGYAQVAAFVSTIMAVGIVTLPTEIKYFNKSVALWRAGLSFVTAVIFTLLISLVMS